MKRKSQPAQSNHLEAVTRSPSSSPRSSPKTKQTTAQPQLENLHRKSNNKGSTASSVTQSMKRWRASMSSWSNKESSCHNSSPILRTVKPEDRSSTNSSNLFKESTARSPSPGSMLPWSTWKTAAPPRAPLSLQSNLQARCRRKIWKTSHQ